jgi:transposase
MTLFNWRRRVVMIFSTEARCLSSSATVRNSCAIESPTSPQMRISRSRLPMQFFQTSDYEFAERKHGRAHIDYHVEVHGHYYSVPHALRGLQLDVRITATAVEFFHHNQRVASHLRSDRLGAHTTIPEHMPSHHRAHSEWSPGRFLNWAVEIGPHTHDFVRLLIESRKHPEFSYRSCLGLLSLAKRYSPQRLGKPHLAFTMTGCDPFFRNDF